MNLFHGSNIDFNIVDLTSLLWTENAEFIVDEYFRENLSRGDHRE